MCNIISSVGLGTLSSRFKSPFSSIKNHTAAWRKEQGKSAQRIGIVSGWMELLVHRCRPNMNQSGTVASGWRRSSALTLAFEYMEEQLFFFFFSFLLVKYVCVPYTHSLSVNISMDDLLNLNRQSRSSAMRDIPIDWGVYWPQPQEPKCISRQVESIFLHVQQIKPWPLGRTPREENIKTKDRKCYYHNFLQEREGRQNSWAWSASVSAWVLHFTSYIASSSTVSLSYYSSQWMMFVLLGLGNFSNGVLHHPRKARFR